MKMILMVIMIMIWDLSSLDNDDDHKRATLHLLQPHTKNNLSTTSTRTSKLCHGVLNDEVMMMMMPRIMMIEVCVQLLHFGRGGR
eukprot:1695045-Karenia_brevis.AAC.1